MQKDARIQSVARKNTRHELIGKSDWFSFVFHVCVCVCMCVCVYVCVCVVFHTPILVYDDKVADNHDEGELCVTSSGRGSAASCLSSLSPCDTLVLFSFSATIQLTFEEETREQERQEMERLAAGRRGQ